MIEIEYAEKLDKKIEQLIDDEFEKQASEHSVKCDYAPINFIARENDEIVGCLTGYTCYDEVYINELIVIQKHRNKGIGSMLMQKVEDYYKYKGFNNINLVTNEFQAPKFYEKCGFELEFIRRNKENPELTKYFFVKYFNKENS